MQQKKKKVYQYTFSNGVYIFFTDYNRQLICIYMAYLSS